MAILAFTGYSFNLPHVWTRGEECYQNFPPCLKGVIVDVVVVAAVAVVVVIMPQLGILLNCHMCSTFYQDFVHHASSAGCE